MNVVSLDAMNMVNGNQDSLQSS